MHNILLSQLVHWFLPHQSNNHRPKLLHADTLIFFISFLAILQLSFRVVYTVRPDILGYATNITLDKLLTSTNEKRKENRVGTVTLNEELSKAAEKKAHDMFAKNYWAHTAPDGTTPWDFIIGEGYHYTFAGENLARDFDKSTNVVEAWMNSPSHRDNMLRAEYDEIGFAVVNGTLNGSETTLVVQMFGTRSPAVAVQKKTQALVQLTPAPGIPVVGASETKTKAAAEPILPNLSKSVVKTPLIDKGFLQRTMSFWFLALFTAVLVVDGIIIWRRQTIRVAGHNLAHVLFLVAIISIIIVGSGGVIL